MGEAVGSTLRRQMASYLEVPWDWVAKPSITATEGHVGGVPTKMMRFQASFVMPENTTTLGLERRVNQKQFEDDAAAAIRTYAPDKYVHPIAMLLLRVAAGAAGCPL